MYFFRSIFRILKTRLWIVLIFALIVRLVAALIIGNAPRTLSGAWDEITYHTLGERWAMGHNLTFPTGWYPWIRPDTPQSYYYGALPYAVGMAYSVIGPNPMAVRLIGVGLGVLHVYLVYRLALRLLDRDRAMLAGWIAAGYAYLIFYNVMIVTETPYMVGLTTSLLLTYQLLARDDARLWAAWGAVIGMTALFRSLILFAAPVLALWVIVNRRSRRAVLYAALAAAIIAVMFLPSIVRNYGLWGRLMLLDSKSGHVFWSANHVIHRDNYCEGCAAPLPPKIEDDLKNRDYNEAAFNDFFMQEAISGILADPGFFLSLCAARFMELFKFWPTADSDTLNSLARVLSFGLILPFALIGLARSLRRWREWTPLYVMIGVNVGVYVVTWAMPRYRVPLDGLFIIMAADGIAAVWTRVKGRFFQEA